MIRGGRKVGASRPAAAAVEMALILPFLAVMFAATVDFGRVFYATQVLDTSAAAGLMYATGTAWAATDTTTAAQTAAVTEGASLNPPLQTAQVTVTYSGGKATVTVSYDFPLLTAALYGEDTVRLQRTAVGRIAPQPSS